MSKVPEAKILTRMTSSRHSDLDQPGNSANTGLPPSKDLNMNQLSKTTQLPQDPSRTYDPKTGKDSNEIDYFLIDGSGSMSIKWWDFLNACDAYTEASKANNLESHLIVHVFDTSDMEMIQRNEPLSTAKLFRDDPIGSHFQGTPLYDAINLAGRRLRELNPKKATIILVTDGDDMDSKTSVVQASAIIKWMKAKGWQVVVIGCDFENSAQAKLLGLHEENSLAVDRKQLTNAARNLAGKRAAYSRDGEDIKFSKDEKTKFGGYLTGPSK